jgi:pyruvate dehydrogenase E2 component (dihydrolipoamide acetyltransferase)
MMAEVVLQREGSTTMQAGVVIAWLSDLGEDVEEGQPLAEIEADKVTFVVDAPVTGTLVQRCAEEGEEVAVGAVLARIGPPGSAPLDSAAQTRGETPHGAAAPMADASASPASMSHQVASPRPPNPTRAAASPAARRLARDLGVDLHTVEGTGPGGRVQRRDIEQAADPLAGLSGTRRRVAERMSRSAREAAPVTLTARADVTDLIAERPQRTRSLPDAVLFHVAALLPRHPDFNAALGPEGVQRSERVHLGYAVDGADGLVVPTVRDADRLALPDLAERRRDLVRRAREGTLEPGDLDDATFTISNLGPFGVEAFTPIITPGQSAVLGMGCVTQELLPGPDGPVERSRLWLSLTFDHRVVDGAPAARFLADLCTALGRELLP